MAEAELVVRRDRDALAATVAERLAGAVEAAIGRRGVAHVVLTGGSMGSAVVAATVAAAVQRPLPATGLHLWWGDERFLPVGDPQRNDTQNDEAGLLRLGVPTTQQHRVLGPDAGVTMDESARAYGAELAEHGVDVFDVVLLGVGPDGHVASLFPHHEAQREVGEVVAVDASPKPPPQRVSMTFDRLGASREVWFVVSGAEKAEAVRRARGSQDGWECPASVVRGREATVWFVDEAAAGR
ncbi:6-phosphogluconolactonase [Janibacter massiliensis]|uniref:6-phosphogluconolactonase n=1 Tax=Janibacter massiliensis TaxID=2058291 RepID=UPI000D10EAA2|nr:6-phosphogluconolactonase [Janibacter massiliensis]